MDASGSEIIPGSAVMLIDALSFRRAALAAVLETWAGSLGWTLLPMGDGGTAQSMPCRMFILNIGGQPISDPVCSEWIRTLRDLSPQTPFVIISDRDGPDETLCAFESGASGFIPANTSPELAFHALTFIAAGGTFFPPSVLMSFAGSSAPPGRHAGRSPHRGPSARPALARDSDCGPNCSA